jgi:hypothetical protein
MHPGSSTGTTINNDSLTGHEFHFLSCASVKSRLMVVLVRDGSEAFIKITSSDGMHIREIILSAVFLAFYGSAHAQFMRDHTIEGDLRGFHSLDGSSVIKRSFKSDNEARTQLDRILSAIGLTTIGDRIILRASADTQAAVAAFDRASGERFIVYNAQFMQDLNRRTGEYWSLLFVLAHEVGHHLAFHVELNGRNHEFELEADYFAGFVLRRMGATLQQAEAAISAIASDASTQTHPGRADRLQAITLGWTDAGGQGAPEVPGDLTQSKASVQAEANAAIRTVELSPFLAITTQSSYLRAQPGRHSQSLRRFETGTPLTITGEVKGEYWFLATDKSGATGYIRKDQVRRLGH